MELKDAVVVITGASAGAQPVSEVVDVILDAITHPSTSLPSGGEDPVEGV